MADFGLVRSFGIDNGELDGLRPQEVFVLGYELAQVDAAMKAFRIGSTWLVHAENQQRIQAYADKLGRKVTFTWMENDVSESWLNLTIEPADPPAGDGVR